MGHLHFLFDYSATYAVLWVATYAVLVLWVV
jgi:hypothetical protein